MFAFVESFMGYTLNSLNKVNGTINELLIYLLNDAIK